MINQNLNINTSDSSPLVFVKEVAKYFMNFLETDFKKRRIPKRNSSQKTEKGVKVAFDLEKYPKLKRVLLEQLNSGFNKNFINIKKGDYTKNLPEILLSLISNKIQNLSAESLEDVFNQINTTVNDYSSMYQKEYDRFVEESIEETKNIFYKSFIHPFITDIEKPLENLGLADENSIYQFEIDIVDSLLSIFYTNYKEIIEHFFRNPNKYNLHSALKEIIKLPEIKDKIISFFESFAIGDAFHDIYQIFKNNMLIDKTEVYLYFYEITYERDRFPVLYLPITIQKEVNKFIVHFEKRIYVNTKAINYVVQEFNLQNQNKSTLAGEFERIIYLNDDNKFVEVLNHLIIKLVDFFKFNKDINVKDSSFQKMENLFVSISNKCYLYLFDKSDEALINDYEIILNDNGELIADFDTLINGFIEDNPTAYIEEIEDSWHNTSIPEKLVFETPIPLNDEQKQVILALQKPDCKLLILEGPPGTGKSHTITAIICKALLEEKSVLVLSDKKEALDVVEDKISDTLNKIRHEDDFQNPILRLGRTGSKFYKIVQGQTISKIKEHYRAYKYKKDEYDKIRKESLKSLEKNIKDNIAYFESINLQDVEFYFKNFSIYSDINWILNEDATSIRDDILRVKEISTELSKFNNCNFKITFITNKNLKSIEEMKFLYQKLEKLKSDFNNLRSYQKVIKGLENSTLEKRLNTLQCLKNINKLFITFGDNLKDSKLSFLKNIGSETTFSDIQQKNSLKILTVDVFNSSKKFFENYLDKIDILENLVIPEEVKITDGINFLNEYLKKLKKLKNPIFGYIFKKNKIYELSRKIKKTFHFFNIEEPTKQLKTLLAIYDLYEFINSKLINNDHKDYLFRDVIELLIQFKKKDELNAINNYLTNLQMISEEIEKIQYLEYLQICYTTTYATFIEIVNVCESIKLTNSKFTDINLELNVSNDYLIYENVSSIADKLNEIRISLLELLKIDAEITFLLNFYKNHPNLCENISLNLKSVNLINLNCSLLNYSDEFIKKYLKFKEIEHSLNNQFSKEPDDKYFSTNNEIENLVIAQMTYFLDKRIIEYTENYANEVQLLKSIVRKKQKFPKPLFENLKKAFPCILAGIRDYAEFIPLERNLFDLVIIDEASQVSIAQSLPALIRGKQIIVLGDDKQFSNVKSNNASTVTNKQHKGRIESVFIKERSIKDDKYGWLTKVKENFDIKNSILKFLRFIRNYECQLKKHFRCYPEIISYSDKHFYSNTLQCMKIRGKPISDVIKFDFIKHDGKIDKTKNTNELEVAFIVNKLKEFKQKNILQSVGIITPHREQVSLLLDKINNLPEKDWLFNKCKLKVMTFDTCQGEERDYIFYPMVATREKDRLNWIFLKDFSSMSEEIEGTIKSQRLNVGFSRAKECIHFVLSKTIEEFKGEIKNAMQHYSNELEIGKKVIIGGTDEKSPMEKKIQKYFYSTVFYKENKDKIEFIPQFPLGNYLKQLDKHYQHPEYKVDFLLIFDNQKIVIEYDGFKEHFTNLNEVNYLNFCSYLKDEDIYRQKILEGYGYKFLRINKFNIGDNPIEALDFRIKGLVKKKS